MSVGWDARKPRKRTCILVVCVPMKEFRQVLSTARGLRQERSTAGEFWHALSTAHRP